MGHYRCRGRGGVEPMWPWCIDRAPRLEPVLIGAGAGAVTAYDEHELPGPVVRRAAVDHDVVLDLADTQPVSNEWSRTVSMPADPFEYTALVVPGLLGALCGHGRATLTVDVLTAAARAIALVTPVDHTLPSLSERSLVPVIARHVSSALVGRPEIPPQRP